MAVEILYPPSVETATGTEIVRVNGTWWRVLWTEEEGDDEGEFTTRIIAGLEPRTLIEALPGEEQLEPWVPKFIDLRDFVESLAEEEEPEYAE